MESANHKHVYDQHDMRSLVLFMCRNELKMMNMAELLRSAKAMHPSIAEACEAALRDMGEENYRS